MTQDVDLTVLTTFGSETAYIDTLLSRFPERVPGARALAVKRRVLLLKTAAEVPIDVALGAIPYEEGVMARSSDWRIGPTVALRTCSAEDLVIMKAVADRDGDWSDIRRIAARRGANLIAS